MKTFQIIINHYGHPMAVWLTLLKGKTFVTVENPNDFEGDILEILEAANANFHQMMGMSFDPGLMAEPY